LTPPWGGVHHRNAVPLEGDVMTRKELITKRCKTWKQKSPAFVDRCIRHCCKGDVLWQVRERVFGGSRQNGVERWIACDPLKPQRGYVWRGHKDFGETNWSRYYSCPLAYLDMVPDLASEAWRKKVKAYHKCRKRKLEVGVRASTAAAHRKHGGNR